MSKEITKLLDIMAELRHPDKGCPWDIEQSFESLSTYTIEEAYEVADAIDLGDYLHLKEELGDLLFQVVFYAQLAKEKGLFDFNEIVQTLNEKMINRHPHVFAKQDNTLNAQEQSQRWEQNKRLEKSRHSVLDDIPKNMPELLKSVKLTKRAAVIGFDWKQIEPVFEKMEEELSELKEAIETQDAKLIKDELGDVLFVCTNLARHLKQDPQLALRHANQKFESRFRAVEKIAKQEEPNKKQYSLKNLDKYWNKVKILEKSNIMKD